MDIRTVIERLGGEAELAGRFKISPKAVEQWTRRNRIPGRWHLRLLKVAREVGADLTEEDLLCL